MSDPVTAFGKRASKSEERSRESILVKINRAGIKPKPECFLRPLGEYKTPRDITREKVQQEMDRYIRHRESGGIQSYLNDNRSIDVILPRLHGTAQNPSKPPHRRPFFVSNY